MSLDESYSYALPSRLVATEPASPRDSAKLLVYKTKTDEVFFDTFRNLGDYLPPKSLLVFNDTKVLPARLPLRKSTGGVVNALLLLNEIQPKDRTVRAMVDRRVTIGEELRVGHYVFSVVGQDAHIFTLRPKFPIAQLAQVATQYGHTPIPPYLKSSKLSESELRTKYQSMFAKHPASVAAPTASLHFTPRLIHSLDKRGVSRSSITLHVGSGTFAPLTDENFRTKKLFREYWQLMEKDAKSISSARAAERPIIAVGTTATRALESSKLKPGHGATQLFITPGYKFQTIDGLITNFHLPGSSLMYLVDAFLQSKNAPQSILDLYSLAIKKKFRFYSFGDGMLIV
jgi:S-adenosylmethionine:tRNA ribosyltransferase-isomerase